MKITSALPDAGHRHRLFKFLFHDCPKLSLLFRLFHNLTQLFDMSWVMHLVFTFSYRSYRYFHHFLIYVKFPFFSFFSSFIIAYTVIPCKPNFLPNFLIIIRGPMTDFPCPGPLCMILRTPFPVLSIFYAFCFTLF